MLAAYSTVQKGVQNRKASTERRMPPCSLNTQRMNEQMKAAVIHMLQSSML